MKSLAARELAAIDAIEAAISKEHRPDYIVLLRHAKDGHQQAFGQLSALHRLGGEQPAQSAGLTGTLAALQTRLTQLVGHTLTLRAMRAVEDHLVGSYREARDASDGLRRSVFDKLVDHGLQRWHILTAHIAHAKGDVEGEVNRLPRPISQYFAHQEPRACMRCMLDRPGTHESINRTDPYTYVCAACHDETRAAFPPELAALVDEWPEDARLARILEKALGKPSKETAKKRVHTVLSGQSPELRGSIRHKSTDGHRGLSPPRAGIVHSDLAHDEATLTERAYSERLFDPSRIRTSW